MAERTVPEDTKDPAAAPVQALGLGYVALVQSTAMALQNAVAQQQSMQVLNRAEASTVCAAILRTALEMEASAPLSSGGGGGFFGSDFDAEGDFAETGDGSGGTVRADAGGFVPVGLLEGPESPLPEAVLDEGAEGHAAEDAEAAGPAAGPAPEVGGTSEDGQGESGPLAQAPLEEAATEELLAAWLYTEDNLDERRYQVT
jgi:hypothetical protein